MNLMIFYKYRYIIISLGFLLLPLFVTDEYFLHILIMAFFYTILSSSLNFTYRTGQLTLAHGSFMGIGAYTSVLLMMKLHFSFMAAFLASGIATGIIALLLGRIILRSREVYFVLITFAFNELARLIFTVWVKLFGGPDGIGNIPPAQLSLLFLNFTFETKMSYYYLTYFITIASLLALMLLLDSPLGKIFRLIKSSEVLTQSVGVNIMEYKTVAFSIGCVFAGLTGSLFAHYFRYISPYSFTFWLSVNVIMINVIGGIGSIRGCVIGSFIFAVLVEAVRIGKQYELMIYGALIIMIVLFFPGGVNRLLESVERRVEET